MTVPNALTLIRLFLSPVVFLFVAFGWYWASSIIYLLGILTDALDGKLARTTQTTSAFGGAMDSTADKTLVAGGMIGLTAQGELPASFIFAFVFREFVVFGLRAIRTTDGSTVAGINDRLGRIRFFVLHLGVILLLTPSWKASLRLTGLWTIGIALILAYMALLFYIKRDFHILRATLKHHAS